jgi:hypothetical protein
MRVKALLLQYGPVPPPGGDARTAFLLDRGINAARDAARDFQQALIDVEAVLGHKDLPFSVHPTGHVDLGDARRRMRAWQTFRARLPGSAAANDHLPGETSARSALAHAVHAFRDLAETQRADRAHHSLHRYGELVSGLYGCWMEWDAEEGIWYDTCPVRLAHIGDGFSIGFTCTRLCSICREDVSECEHLSILPYTIVAERYVDDDDRVDRCSVCHEEACEHAVGSEYKVYQWQLMRNPMMHEATITPTPREPRARIGAMEMDPQPPPPRRPSERVTCTDCLLACGRGTPPR